MFFSKLKISTKLIISSTVFLVPIGVMLFFIISHSLGIMRASRDEQAGIRVLRPTVTVMQLLPEYLNVYLGLEQGNLRQLDEQITSAIRAIERGIRDLRGFEAERMRVEAQGFGFPNPMAEWEELRRTARDNEELFDKFVNFAKQMQYSIRFIGGQAGLTLVSDRVTYYFMTSVLSTFPEASVRAMEIGFKIKQNFYQAQTVITRWNNDLADAQALGRRLGAVPFAGGPGDITVSMLPSYTLQTIRNSRSLFRSDMTRIGANFSNAFWLVDENKRSDFDEIENKLRNNAQIYTTLDEQFGRMVGFGVANPATLAEVLDTMLDLNFSLCEFWAESLNHLEKLIQRSAAQAQRQLALYLTLVLVSLGLAVAIVVFITRDIGRSTATLKTLFKGLDENDLTLSLPIRTEDEFGELMKAFNGFLDILRSTFGSFKESTQQVADSVFDISSSSKEITTTANQQSASVSEIVSTMENSKNLSEQIAIKTTEVANLAIETQGLSNKGAELSETNLLLMEEILKQNQKTINEMRNLSDMIVRISEAIRIIDSIADQTKLIAFNASLEASSSGEAGARFSVVASEIRRFADNVVESTHEIKQKIEEVQEASQTLIAVANNGSKQIEIGYKRMGEQKEEFEQIVDNSQNVATRSQQISNLSKQQELASSQIFIALKEISAGVKQFVVATSSTSKIADFLNGMSEDLKQKVEKFRTET